jgi:hypothetical protein
MRVWTSALALSLFAPAAIASVITYDFTGDAFYTLGIFAGQGTQVTGTISFDDRIVDFSPTAAGDTFSANLEPNSAFAGNFRATIQVGSAVASYALHENDVDDWGWLWIADDTTFDWIDYFFVGNQGGQTIFELTARDNGGVAVKPGSYGLTSTIEGDIGILDALDLGLFKDRAFGTWARRDVSYGPVIDSVQFAWTGISRSISVPEPAPALLLATALLGLAVRYRKRLPGP